MSWKSIQQHSGLFRWLFQGKQRKNCLGTKALLFSLSFFYLLFSFFFLFLSFSLTTQCKRISSGCTKECSTFLRQGCGSQHPWDCCGDATELQQAWGVWGCWTPAAAPGWGVPQVLVAVYKSQTGQECISSCFILFLLVSLSWRGYDNGEDASSRQRSQCYNLLWKFFD